MVIAAESQVGRRLEVALWEIGREFDVTGVQYIGRHRNNGGTCGNPARGCLDRDVPVTPRHSACRRRKRHRDLLAELRDQRSQPLTADKRPAALLRACLVGDRDFLQVLAGGGGAQYELRRTSPVAEILWHHRRTRHVRSGSRGLVDGAVSAGQSSEKFFG